MARCGSPPRSSLVVAPSHLRRSARSTRSMALGRRLAASHVGDVQERLGALFLDARGRIIAEREVFIGTLHTALVSTRDVLRLALSQHARAVVVFHNHPSGDTQPSDEDIAYTRRLASAAQLLDVELVDHLVLAGDRYIYEVSRRFLALFSWAVATSHRPFLWSVRGVHSAYLASKRTPSESRRSSRDVASVQGPHRKTTGRWIRQPALSLSVSVFCACIKIWSAQSSTTCVGWDVGGRDRLEKTMRIASLRFRTRRARSPSHRASRSPRP